jgi:DNA-binding NarL/FixJ family response regulator
MTRPEKLTPQQARVAMMVAEGATDKAIAAELGIHVQTVRFHIRGIAAAWNLEKGKVTRVLIALKVPRKAA